MEEYIKIRTEWLESDTKRDKDLKVPEDVECRYDVYYGAGGQIAGGGNNIPDEEKKWNLLDIYTPKARSSSPLPVIVSIHGGGYVYGTKEIYRFYGMSLALRGFAFVNFNYRLAPENKFPSALEDTCKVMKWLADNGPGLGLDIDNVFVVGDSAGAHYASLYLAAYSNSDYASLCGIEPEKRLMIRACALNCGVYDPLILRREDGLDDLTAYLFSEENWKDMAAEYLQTHRFLNKDYPPVFLMSGTNDFLLHQLEPMKDHLNKSGIECVSKIYGEEDPEKAYHVFHVDMNNVFQKECNDDETAFFKAHLV
ncbi:MAG: alpha/beta hydrolase [Lachnospiraceae bacterium]|nr:alpha/beta hydrolase [Lachnospiraceae bacterium]